MRKRPIADFFAKFYLRYGRGNALLDFVIQTFKFAFYFGGTNFFFNLDLTNFQILTLAPIFTFLCYLVGYLDEKVGFWKIQNDYSYTELTPYFEEWRKTLWEKLDEIKTELKNNNHKGQK